MVDHGDISASRISISIENWRKLREEGRDGDALVESTRLADEVPVDIGELNALCELATVIGRPTWIVLFCQRYLANYDDPNVHMKLALAYHSQGRSSDAERHAEAAIVDDNVSLDVLRGGYEILRRKYQANSPFIVALARRAHERDRNSAFDEVRYVEAVATHEGIPAALRLIDKMRHQAGSDVGRWMLITGLQVDWGLLREAKQDFDRGLLLLRDDDLSGRASVVLMAGKLGLFETMLEHVLFLDRISCSDSHSWQHIFWRSEEYKLSVIKDIAARNLFRLDPSHVEAKKFLESSHERLLTIRGLFDDAEMAKKPSFLSRVNGWLKPTGIKKNK